MQQVNAVLRGLIVLVLQFALGHILGVGGALLLGAGDWELPVLATGCALGVSLAGLIVSRPQSRWSTTPASHAMGAIAGAGSGVLLVIPLPPLGYAGTAIPVLASMFGFYVAGALRSAPSLPQE